MYLMQIVAWHMGSGCCGGARESDVIRTLMEKGVSEGTAKLDIDLAVQHGKLRRVRC